MSIKVVVRNKKARYDFEFIEQLEAGIALHGTEVKSLRLGKGSIAESHIIIDRKLEAWIVNFGIPHYEFGNINNHVENRKRKLLLHKDEIAEISKRLLAEKLTLIPTEVYFKKNKVKVQVALVKGKKKYDKRESEKKKETEKMLRQEFKYRDR